MANPLKTSQFPAFTGGKSRSLQQRLADGAVNVAEMPNFVGNGTTDDIIPIKAAIAKALSDQKGCVIFPDGPDIAHSETIFAGFAADPTNPAYSLALVKIGSGNHNGYGGRLRPLFDDDVAVKLGPGQGMMCHGLTVYWDVSSPYRGLQNPGSISFGVSGGSGGASRFAFRHCHALHGYKMFETGLDDGALSDSGIFDSCSGENIVDGYVFGSSQSYIHTIINNRVNAKRILYTPFGHNINVVGGNWSGVSSRAAQFSITNISTVTATASGNGFTYSFTAEVTSPDADLEAGGVYDDAVIDDAQFGLIPLSITGYNAGTNVISLSTPLGWSGFYGQGTNLKTGSNLQTRIQAATTLGVGERLTPFAGNSISQSGTIHLENGSGYTRFLDTSVVGFAGGTAISTFENVHANYDVALPVGNNETETTVKQKLQRSHRFVDLSQGGLIIDNMCFSQTVAGGASLVWPTSGNRIFQVRYPQLMHAPNVRCYPQQDAFTNNYVGPSSGAGDGEWYPNPFVPVSSLASADIAFRTVGWNRTEHWGFFPAFDKTPRISPSQATTLQGTLPTFVTGGNISYPLLCGGQNYSIGSPAGTNGADRLICSTHNFYSYGQDLTTTNITSLAWSFYGGTRKLVVNSNAFERLFPGLGIFLAHASINSGTPFECLVQAINKVDGYAEVSAVSGWILPGTAGTQYSGTTIGQAAYVFKKVTGA